MDTRNCSFIRRRWQPQALPRSLPPSLPLSPLPARRASSTNIYILGTLLCAAFFSVASAFSGSARWLSKAKGAYGCNLQIPQSLSRHAYQARLSGIGQTPLCGLGFFRGRLGHGKRFAGGQKHVTLAAADAKVWKMPLPPHLAVIFFGKPPELCIRPERADQKGFVELTKS